jgi:hypothetical protein
VGASEELQHAALLRDLGAMERVPVGTRMHVEEDGFIYIGVGTIASDIARWIEWTHANVWMPEHALQRIQLQHTTLLDPIAVASFILMNPMSIHHDSRAHNYVYLIVGAGVLRDQGLVQSRRALYVDAVVELRHVNGGVLPRLFHLSPRDQNMGGSRLWP